MPVGLLMAGLLLVIATGCTSTPDATVGGDVAPSQATTSGSTEPATAQPGPSGPSASATRVLTVEDVCLGGCVREYEFVRRPALIVYDDGAVLRTPSGEHTSAGSIDLDWLRERMATYLAGSVEPLGIGPGVEVADGAVTTVDYLDAAGAATRLRADHLWIPQLDSGENAAPRADLRALLADVVAAVEGADPADAQAWTPGEFRVTALEGELDVAPTAWPDIDPALTAQLAPGRTVVVTGPNATILAAAAADVPPFSTWTVDGRTVLLAVVPVLP